MAQERTGGRHRPYAALQYRDFRLLAAGGLMASVCMQMVGVCVGWQVYRLTHSVFALGLVGLVQVVPAVALALPAGQLADRVRRKTVVLSTAIVLGLAVSGLAFVAIWPERMPFPGAARWANEMLVRAAHRMGDRLAAIDSLGVPWMYVILAVMSTARTFYAPARSALLPNLVPPEAFSNAVAWNSSFFQLAAVCGPALGGLLLAKLGSGPRAYADLYLCGTFGLAAQVATVAFVREPPSNRGQRAATLADLVAGLRFVFQRRVILAAVTLDMFAVLLGGATALLPVYADRILQVGPSGLGFLRAAPSVGAVLMALTIAHRPPLRRAGPALMWAVTGFGLCIIGFGLSRSFALSLLLLGLSGACDNISVVVRQTLVQMLTPDSMRGRVSAVNLVFVRLSNEMGELESGLVAAVFGPVFAVVSGGVGTLLVMLAVRRWAPELAGFGSLAEVRPSDESLGEAAAS